jgi:outer membrane protein OmpA-like peptidoglycan-associated protein
MSILSNKIRVGTVGITLAAMSFAALPAAAATPSRSPAGQQPASKQENIGAFTGLGIGAVAGGPLGAMVGLAAGAWLGDRYHRQSVANHDLAANNHDLAADNRVLVANLTRSEAVRQDLAGKLDLITHSLASVRAQRTELDRTVQLSDDIETDVAFRTADASINNLELPALRKIGALAASLPSGEKVRIDGYADPRGSARFNDGLSLRRAEAVAKALVKAGCPQDRLLIEGHGSSDSTSPRGDLDAYAFDRRVTVRLEGPFASHPSVADADLRGASAAPKRQTALAAR